ncbi:MAG: ATP-binding cassette domain-containing protein [Candidatus Poribacteria bacterium]|nr:ATP-binding cassette domain-containing protein [Candidatus Poribacteria bacterium]
MIEVKNLTKNYGSFAALKGISFHIEKGEVIGFLGPNGAGKTTTMRILTCFMPPTSGRAIVAGYDVFSDSLAVRKRVGYIPENVPLYHEMTTHGYLKYVAKIKGTPQKELTNRIDYVMNACGLLDRQHQIIGQLSKGYRQRVGLAQSLIHNPDVIILDEPTSGLDPRQVIEIRELVKELGKDRTIILSTHILAEVSLTCERVIIINEGEIAGDILLSNGGVSSIKRASGTQASLNNSNTLDLEIHGNPQEIESALAEIPGVDVIDIRDSIYRVSYPIDVDLRSNISSTIISKGWKLLEMRSIEMTIEEVFLRLTSRHNQPLT